MTDMNVPMYPICYSIYDTRDAEDIGDEDNELTI
jgi:hypothetical protein